MTVNKNSVRTEDRNKREILLVLMPFWTPLIPPMGIICLKNFYVDVNVHQLNELNRIVLELFNRLENRLLEILKKEEPDLMGISDLSDFNLEFYPYLPYYASRGCPYNCSFCSETIRWGKYRKKNLEKVAAEIIALGGKYNSQLFLLTDSLLNPIIDDFSKELIALNASIYWDGYLRADKGINDIERMLLWRKLHKNAVPPLSEFSKKNYIDENENVTKLSYIKSQIWEESEFSF